jgi:hypothetical protein
MTIVEFVDYTNDNIKIIDNEDIKHPYESSFDENEKGEEYEIKKIYYGTELLISTFILLTNFSVSTGGYVLITYIILVPYLIKNEEYDKLLFFIFIIFALPVDWLYLIKIHNAYIYSYFDTITIYNPDLYIGWGSLVRPLSNFYIMFFFITHLMKKYRYSSNLLAP